jgi:hypothetical protein
MLLWDGPTTQGLVAGTATVALAVTSQTLRPAETDFLVSIIPSLAAVAMIPASFALTAELGEAVGAISTVKSSVSRWPNAGIF